MALKGLRQHCSAPGVSGCTEGCPKALRHVATIEVVSTSDIEWLNTNETAKRLGITPRTLYRFIDDGKIPAYRFGRVIRLKESEVAAFIEQSRIVPGTLDTSAVDEESVEAG